MEITKGNNEVRVILNSVQHEYQCLIFWKTVIEGKVEYGFTVCNEDNEDKKYQLDYDTFSRNNMVELVKGIAELIKEEVK